VTDSLILLSLSHWEDFALLAPSKQPAISLFGWYSLIDDNSSEFLSGEEGATKGTLDDTFDKAAS
jgi:hypothetical protein